MIIGSRQAFITFLSALQQKEVVISLSEVPKFYGRDVPVQTLGVLVNQNISPAHSLYY